MYTSVCVCMYVKLQRQIDRWLEMSIDKSTDRHIHVCLFEDVHVCWATGTMYIAPSLQPRFDSTNTCQRNSEITLPTPESRDIATCPSWRGHGTLFDARAYGSGTTQQTHLLDAHNASPSNRIDALWNPTADSMTLSSSWNRRSTSNYPSSPRPKLVSSTPPSRMPMVSVPVSVANAAAAVDGPRRVAHRCAPPSVAAQTQRCFIFSATV